MTARGPQSTAEHAQSERRHAMVQEQVEARGVHDPDVLAALRAVPRHLFVPPALVDHAYDDGALAIGYGQTISQPYIVALMTALAQVNVRSKVLEVGTGSGYQTAVLAELAGEVFSIERRHELEESADLVLARLGYHNVTTMLGDGSLGLPEHAPFDRIVVTAAAPAGAAAAPRAACRRRPSRRAGGTGRRRPGAQGGVADGGGPARGREHPLPLRAARRRERLRRHGDAVKAAAGSAAIPDATP